MISTLNKPRLKKQASSVTPTCLSCARSLQRRAQLTQSLTLFESSVVKYAQFFRDTKEQVAVAPKISLMFQSV